VLYRQNSRQITGVVLSSLTLTSFPKASDGDSPEEVYNIDDTTCLLISNCAIITLYVIVLFNTDDTARVDVFIIRYIDGEAVIKHTGQGVVECVSKNS
jgi:hypothetical protein